MLVAVRSRYRFLRGTNTAGVISIWLALSLITIAGQTCWTLFQQMLHSGKLEIISDAVVRGHGSSSYLVVLVRNNSTNVANDVRAFVQIGKQPFIQSSSKLIPSALQVAPTQEVVFIFDHIDDVTPSQFHLTVDTGYWTNPNLWAAPPNIHWANSRGTLHAIAVNSTPLTTQPFTLVGLVFGQDGRIQAIGSIKIDSLHPLTSVAVDVPFTIGSASGWRTMALFEDRRA